MAGARTRSATPGRRRSEHGRARPTSPDRPRPRIGDRPSGRADVLRRTGGWPCEDAPADPNERHCHGRNEAVGGRRVRRGAGRDGDRVSGPGNRSGSSLWRIGIRDPPDPNSHTRCVSQTRSTSPARVLTAGRQRAAAGGEERPRGACRRGRWRKRRPLPMRSRRAATRITRAREPGAPTSRQPTSASVRLDAWNSAPTSTRISSIACAPADR